MDDIPTDVSRVRPRGDQVLIRRLEKNESTKGGIVLPEMFRRDFFKAEVLRVGPGGYGDGEWRQSIDLLPGDIVMVIEEKRGPGGHISKHLISVMEDEREFLLVLESYVYAVEEPAKETENGQTANRSA